MDLTSIIGDIYNAETTEENIALQAKNLSKNIAGNNVRLVDVIESLGPKLTSPEVQDRVKAMGFLSKVFTFMKSDFLTEKELTFIVDFLHDRMKDQHVVIPKVFLCVLPIIQCKNLPEGSTAKLLNQIFLEGNVQSHIHKYRRAAFQSFEYALRNRLEELKKLSSTDFVMNFLQSMDGEKDPRNLLVLFNSIPIILTHFPLGPFVEEFFDVLSCYFPVDFKPSAPVAGGEVITREDLAKPLHKCLSQTNQFCKYLVPLLMEKLDSSIIDAKIDSLDLLGLCCERSYTAEDLNPFLPTIWHALRREIFMGGNELVETACINFIRSAFSVISRNDNVLKSSVTMIFTECKHHLSEPELRLSQPTARILTAMAEGSKESCQSVLSLTVPLLHEQFSIKPTSSVRKGLLGIMTTLVSTLRLYPTVKLETVLRNWDEVLAMWFTLLTHSDTEFTLLALEFFTRLLNNSLKSGLEGKSSENKSENENIDSGTADHSHDPDDLDENSRSLLQEHLLSLLARSDIPAEVRASVFTTMDEIAKSFGDEFVKTSVPRILSMISSQENALIPQAALNALAECSAYPIVAKLVIPHLLDSELDEKIVLCLASIVEKGCEKNVSSEAAEKFTNFMWVEQHSANIISKLISVFGERRHTVTDYLTLSRIVRILIRSTGESFQQEIVNNVWNINLEKGDGDGESGNILKTDIPPLLLEAILGSVRPSIRILQRNKLVKVLLDRITAIPILLEKDQEAQNSLNEIAAIRLYAVLLNKSDEVDFPVLLSEVETVINGHFHLVSSAPVNQSNGGTSDLTPSEPPNESHNAGVIQIDDTSSGESISKAYSKRIVVFFTTIVKALAMRGVSTLNNWIDKMVTLLDSPAYGLILSNELPTLMAECPFSLNEKSFCNIRFLYKQRLFMECVPRLVAAYGRSSTNSGSIRANYMRALSSQLKHVPGPVLQMQIDKVFPLLMASLSVDSNVEILLSTLNALLDFFKSKSEQSALGTGGTERSTLIEYFHDMAPRLLTLTTFKLNMEVRILSLRCLQCCAKLPTHVILPLRPTITSSLKRTLDDPKRLVRKDAATTRNIWILVGAPGGY